MVVLFFFYDTIFLNILISAAIVIALYELLVATKYVQNKALTLVSLLFAAIVPFFSTPYYGFGIFSAIACFAFIFALFAIMFVQYKTLKIEQIGMVFLVSVLISLSFSCIAYIRDIDVNHGGFYIYLIAMASWGTDTGAYFIGTFFGKRKLMPDISPKKTVEGFIGGLIFCLVAFIISGYVYSFLDKGKVSILALAAISLPLSVLSVFGDLTASLIKRACHIKDFGKILPGHGGILDRFDSMLFVAPVLYLFVQIFPIILD